MSPLRRKSVEPLAAHIAPTEVRSRNQSLHQFVAAFGGSHKRMLPRVCQWVVPKKDCASGAWWIIDDNGIGFPKQGRHCVGVASQCCAMPGKQACPDARAVFGLAAAHV